MEHIYKKIENELNTLDEGERNEILNKLRDEIDKIDKQLVHLISKRTLQSVLIGRIKRTLNLPTYNPQREKEISQKISNYVEEPLKPEAILRIYERILDESRAIQKEEAVKGNIFKVTRKKMKIGFDKLLSRRDFFIVVAFFLVILSLLYYTFFTPNYYKGKSPLVFEVKKSEPFGLIVDDLYKKGVIPSKTNMRITAFLYGAEKSIKAARYYIPNGLNYLDLMGYLLHGKSNLLVDVTIKNGVSIDWVAEKLHNSLYIDSTAIVKLAYDKNLIDSMGIKGNSLLGYMLPQTYQLYQRSSSREIIDSIYTAFKSFMVDSLRKRAKKFGYSIHDILTIASIVQGETNNVSEMPEIAAVYFNRLKKGMKLQADPTIQFLLKGKWKRLSYKDLQINSPYNTYKYAGLPPGPIDNPGKEAILATFYPAKNNYLYFVADGYEKHVFSNSYSKHLENVKKYKEWLKKQKSK